MSCPVSALTTGLVRARKKNNPVRTYASPATVVFGKLIEVFVGMNLQVFLSARQLFKFASCLIVSMLAADTVHAIDSCLSTLALTNKPQSSHHAYNSQDAILDALAKLRLAVLEAQQSGNKSLAFALAREFRRLSSDAATLGLDSAAIQKLMEREKVQNEKRELEKLEKEKVAESIESNSRWNRAEIYPDQSQTASIIPAPGNARALQILKDTSIRLIDLNSKKVIAQIPVAAGFTSSVVFSGDGSRFLVGKYASELAVYDSETGALIRKLPENLKLASGDFALNFDGTKIAFPTYYFGTFWHKYAVEVWDVDQGKSQTVLSQRSGMEDLEWADITEFSIDGRKLIMNLEGKGLVVYNIRPKIYAIELAVPGNKLFSAKFFAEGKYILAHSAAGIRTFDAATGKLLQTQSPPPGASSFKLAWISGNTAVAVGHYDSSSQDTVVVWNAVTGSDVRTLSDHTSLLGLAGGLKSKKLLVTVDAQYVNLWDPTLGVKLDRIRLPRDLDYRFAGYNLRVRIDERDDSITLSGPYAGTEVWKQNGAH